MSIFIQPKENLAKKKHCEYTYLIRSTEKYRNKPAESSAAEMSIDVFRSRCAYNVLSYKQNALNEV